MSIKRSSKIVGAGIVAALGLAAATTAQADQPAAVGGTVVLRTAISVAHDPLFPLTRVNKQSGAGVMDTHVAFGPVAGVTTIATLFTESVDREGPRKNNDNSGVQGTVLFSKLTETGLTNGTAIALPTLDGERTWMRPNVALTTTGKALLIAASEDNGQNNNPQAVAFVYDAVTGLKVNITNTNRGSQEKPTNLIQLSGKNDNQQYGPHSICPTGPEAGGGEGFVLGLQRNNQNAYIMKVVVKDTAGGAEVTVPYLNKVLNNARHCRPQLACPPGGALTGPSVVMTTVEANNQPADIGVRALVINTQTGAVIASKLVAPTIKAGTLDAAGVKAAKTKHAVQPSVAYISPDVVAIQYQVSANARGGNNGNGNGHTGGENLSMLMTLKSSDLTKIDEIVKPASFQRHGRSFGTMYGAGAATPAVAVMSGSSTGTGKGLVQMFPIGALDGKIALPDPLKLYEVSTYSDVANLPARGKRNPNDQGAGFINGFAGLKNPGYLKPGGFMPEVSQFTVAAVPGYKDAAAATLGLRDSLVLSLIPSAWDPAVQTVPGGATPTDDIKPGPSPTNNQTPTSTGDPTDKPVEPPADTTYELPPLSSDTGGCSVSSTPSTGNLGGLALVAGLALIALRRSSKKES